MTAPGLLRRPARPARAIIAPGCRRERPLFTFLNVAALHQPNRLYLPGRRRGQTWTRTPPPCSTSTTAPRRGCSRLVTGRGRPCQVIICSDHGTAVRRGRPRRPPGRPTRSCGRCRTPSSFWSAEIGDYDARRLPVPGLPVRVPAQDRLPAARPRPRARRRVAGERHATRSSFTCTCPFCEMRCGFCNLFTRGEPAGRAGHARTSRQLRRQADRGPRTAARPRRRFARIGDRRRHPDLPDRRPSSSELFDIVETTFGADYSPTPMSVETSPATATPDRLAVLAAHGAHPGQHRRAELPRRRGARRRPTATPAEVDAALDAIRDAGRSRCSTST